MTTSPVHQLPDSEICTAAIEFVRTVSEPFVFNHVMRSAIYADTIGQKQKLTYDREVVCVSAVLHDLGWTDIVPVQERFEVESADAAKEFLARQGMSELNLEIVWDAIALHTTLGIPQRKCREIALCQMGIFADLGVISPELMTHDLVNALLDDYPWLDVGESVVQTLVGLYERNPKAAESHVVSDCCVRRVPGFQRTNMCDFLLDERKFRRAPEPQRLA
jgi:hypothetical protein